MAVNDVDFRGKRASETYLEARGFDRVTGMRSGGIVDPQTVVLPAGSVLFRLYHVPLDTARFGGWWFTPSEMKLVIDYFARDGAAFATGRAQGKGILHATLAVRHDWSRYRGSPPSPDHLGNFLVVRLRDAFRIYFGPADVAPSEDQRQVQKPVEITDAAGRRRRVWQVFIPAMFSYRDRCENLMHGQVGQSDSDLIRTVDRYAGTRLPCDP